MRRVLVVLAAVLLAVPVLQAQATKTVRGKVTAVTGNSVTVDVAGKPMEFAVDAKTTVERPGGSHATAAAKAEGKAGVAITDMVKVGDGVEVRYHEMGGTMHAASIKTGITAKSGDVTPKPPTTMTARGTVSSVAADSLTISSSGKDMTFSIDKDTFVQATGATRATEAAKKEGKPGLMITDVVHTGDTVSVRYKSEDGKMMATDVRVTQKAKK